MKNVTPKTFTQSMKAFFQMIGEMLRRAVRSIAAMPWPMLLLAALALALVITIIPLAIFLFAVFLAIKLAVAAFGKPPRLLPPPQAPENQ
ncbi:MAG TPA: hypothetical protein VFT37_12590 [Telluria sp.]|nr:hypothetical protein [Telluria sp.]